jgi:GDP-mannose pyrophosphatase NudK
MNNDKVTIISEDVLSDNWYILKKYTFDYKREDGKVERQSRESYDRGNGATILLYNTEKPYCLQGNFAFQAM